MNDVPMDFNDGEYGDCLREAMKPEAQERLARIAAEECRAREAQPPEQPPRPSPEIEAMQQMLSEAFHREMILRAELVRVRRSTDNNGVRNP